MTTEETVVPPAETASSAIAENTENAQESQTVPDNPAEPEETSENTESDDRTQIVVFGDSIWDSTRDETGIAYLVSQYTGADVYNCAIGGTRATLKAGESSENYDTWDSTSLSGMVNVAIGKVDPEIFLEGYITGGIIRNIDFSKTDYFIIAYGLNDYFAGAPLNADNSQGRIAINEKRILSFRYILTYIGVVSQRAASKIFHVAVCIHISVFPELTVGWRNQ